MGRADAVPGHFGRGVLELNGEKIGGLSSNRQQIRFAGGGVMHASGRHQVAHVVHLEIHRIAETRNIFTGALADLDIRVDVPVRILRPADEGDEAIHFAIECRNRGSGRTSRRRLQAI